MDSKHLAGGRLLQLREDGANLLAKRESQSSVDNQCEQRAEDVDALQVYVVATRLTLSKTMQCL
jgi:hypothetical protein